MCRHARIGLCTILMKGPKKYNKDSSSLRVLSSLTVTGVKASELAGAEMGRSGNVGTLEDSRSRLRFDNYSIRYRNLMQLVGL